MTTEAVIAFFAGKLTVLSTGLVASVIAARQKALAKSAGDLGAPAGAVAVPIARVPAQRPRASHAQKKCILGWGRRKEHEPAVQTDLEIMQAGGLTLAGLLASLPHSRVDSDLPGRVRLRVDSIKGHARHAQFTASVLMTGDGIHAVKANPLTGSVLIYYDTDRYHTLGALMGWIVVEQE